MRKIYLINEQPKYDGDNSTDNFIEAYSSKKKAKKRAKKLEVEDSRFHYYVHPMGLNVTSQQYIKKTFRK